MPDDLTSFKGLVHRVDYALRTTQLQYDKCPPKADLFFIAEGINAWPFICSCYMGIEQTMKLLIRMRDGAPEQLLRNTHNLECLYALLHSSEQDVVASYYRVYRSLHNFDSGSIALETADDFIQHIGDGYTKWRYILVENPEPPKTHVGLMLETWRALAHLAVHRVWGRRYHTLAHYLGGYIEQNVFRVAEMDKSWEAAIQDGNSGVEFRELREWLYHKGSPLAAGINLFHHHAAGTGDSVKASPLLRKALLRAADKAVSNFPTHRRGDILMFHHRIGRGDLSWNANKGKFE